MNMWSFPLKPLNELENEGRSHEPLKETEVTCPVCRATLKESEVVRRGRTCICGHHWRLGARERLSLIADADSFEELYPGVTAGDPLAFPGYGAKLEKARSLSGEEESVICGTCTIRGRRTAIFAMDPNFMMGSMGSATGEKITLLFEYATANRLPVIGYTVSGGARMQEGLLSLMQMAKTSEAVRRHREENLYISFLTDPTTGGVTASFAMEGDIILAEPGATIGFAGARVIEQTTREKLPKGFQTAEFLLEKGFVDRIVPRGEQRRVLSTLLALHERKIS